jgi:uncharacterized protein (TIGR02145 family)
MNRHIKTSILSLLAVTALLLFTTCTRAPTTGTGTETENVAAMLYNPGGSPAANATVRFYTAGSDPRSNSGDSTVTDVHGYYAVKLDTGTYNLIAHGDSGMVFRDSIKVLNDSTSKPPADTLKAPGSIKGIVQLQPGDDARTVFILFMGTHTFTMPGDDTGHFTTDNIAAGTYSVRILTTIPNYKVLDTNLSVIAGTQNVLLQPIVLQYTGIPGPIGLKLSYDTLRQTVVLAWNKADTSLIDGYNVYRAIKGQNFILVTQTPLLDTVIIYHDSTVIVGNTYSYRVVSWKASGEESPKLDIPGDTVEVVSSSLVTTTFIWNLNNTIHDTASINDTIKACLTYSNPTRKIVKVVWYADSLNSPVVRQKSDSSLTGKDTLAYWCNQARNKKIFVKVTDGAGMVWLDSFTVIIVQDVPQIAFISRDTVIDHGGIVRCSVYVQQQFGTMNVDVDTANSGNFKSLGTIELAGGKSYSFSTGSACSWDSVKIRITDDDNNVLIKGFKVRIRPRSLTITGIDSTVNTITVHYSQSQENDFTEYSIYRNITNSVDTNSELWATVTAIGTISYTTPSLDYTWQPRYYRIYQKDNEGLLGPGSNVVYGCIVNSPPPTPVITYPVNDGDSIWADATIRWTKCIDPNGNGVRYRVLADYNNNGYAQLASELTGPFVKLTEHDSLPLKWKVIAYDTLGDSSAWSAERFANKKPFAFDIDGNSYHYITIGTQVWMVENLKTTRYNDGTAIPLVTGPNDTWQNLLTPAYCWMNNDSAYKNPYGALYTWYTVNTGNLAPAGWHVPTDAEWTILSTYLGGDSIAGGILKDTATTLWMSPNTGATNAVGFTALPAGDRNTSGPFEGLGGVASWWSVDAQSSGGAWYCYTNYGHPNLYHRGNNFNTGHSVRCVRNP